jgi:hypothetical protein
VPTPTREVSTRGLLHVLVIRYLSEKFTKDPLKPKYLKELREYVAPDVGCCRNKDRRQSDYLYRCATGARGSAYSPVGGFTGGHVASGYASGVASSGAGLATGAPIVHNRRTHCRRNKKLN